MLASPLCSQHLAHCLAPVSPQQVTMLDEASLSPQTPGHPADHR